MEDCTFDNAIQRKKSAVSIWFQVNSYWNINQKSVFVMSPLKFQIHSALLVMYAQIQTHLKNERYMNIHSTIYINSEEWFSTMYSWRIVTVRRHKTRTDPLEEHLYLCYYVTVLSRMLLMESKGNTCTQFYQLSVFALAVPCHLHVSAETSLCSFFQAVKIWCAGNVVHILKGR